MGVWNAGCGGLDGSRGDAVASGTVVSNESNRKIPFSLRAVGRERWGQAQSHEAAFWQGGGAMDPQHSRVSVRYQALLEKLAKEIAPESRVLEVGCGPTCAARLLGARRTVFLDPLMVSYEPLLANEARGKAVCAVGETLPFGDGTFDYAVSFNAIDHVLAPAEFLEEMARVVRPGGKIVVGVYTHPRAFAFLRSVIERTIPFLREKPHPFFFSRNSFERLLDAAGLDVDELSCVHAKEIRPGLHRQDWVAVATRP